MKKKIFFVPFIFSCILLFSTACSSSDDDSVIQTKNVNCDNFFEKTDYFTAEFEATQITNDFGDAFTKGEKYKVNIEVDGISIVGNDINRDFYFLPKIAQEDCDIQGDNVRIILDDGTYMITLNITGNEYTVIIYFPGTARQATLKYRR